MLQDFQKEFLYLFFMFYDIVLLVSLQEERARGRVGWEGRGGVGLSRARAFVGGIEGRDVPGMEGEGLQQGDKRGRGRGRGRERERVEGGYVRDGLLTAGALHHDACADGVARDPTRVMCGSNHAR